MTTGIAGLLFLMVVAGGGIADARNAGAAYQSDEMVALEGVLRLRVDYGPPGFGETPKTDSRVKIYYVELGKPVSLRDLKLKKNQFSQPSYKKIQLWCGEQFDRCMSFINRNVGAKIVVSGTVDYAVEANDRLPVTMRIYAIERQN